MWNSIVVFGCLVFGLPAFTRSCRTDTNGGHYNCKTGRPSKKFVPVGIIELTDSAI